ncbi:translation initiation factor IF-2-like isoform X2 [Balaenoptera musculus]|uniref:Translation initiation factor IF-2-like isoform X2 n=1 Tax=Balaenoptera musculus TaxID=9771 RepID=A0A8B8WIX2_BALMU|nr:translation initiation factor IF-2-like isoform X2 [Balaenoptera musculus]
MPTQAAGSLGSGVHHLLGLLSLQVSRYSLPQPVISRIHWPVLQRAAGAWTRALPPETPLPLAASTGQPFPRSPRPCRRPGSGPTCQAPGRPPRPLPRPRPRPAPPRPTPPPPRPASIPGPARRARARCHRGPVGRGSSVRPVSGGARASPRRPGSRAFSTAVGGQMQAELGARGGRGRRPGRGWPSGNGDRERAGAPAAVARGGGGGDRGGRRGRGRGSWGSRGGGGGGGPRGGRREAGGRRPGRRAQCAGKVLLNHQDLAPGSISHEALGDSLRQFNFSSFQTSP